MLKNKIFSTVLPSKPVYGICVTAIVDGNCSRTEETTTGELSKTFTDAVQESFSFPRDTVRVYTVSFVGETETEPFLTSTTFFDEKIFDAIERLVPFTVSHTNVVLSPTLRDVSDALKISHDGITAFA